MMTLLYVVVVPFCQGLTIGGAIVGIAALILV
jgi:hypothetical protein